MAEVTEVSAKGRIMINHNTYQLLKPLFTEQGILEHLLLSLLLTSTLKFHFEGAAFETEFTFKCRHGNWYGIKALKKHLKT